MRQIVARLIQNRLAFIIGGIVFSGALGSGLLVDTIYSDTQAQGMIEAMAGSARTLCFAIITASATIIPLMLTMLSFIHQVDREFDAVFYTQIRTIVLLSSTALILSVLVLLLLTIPLVESEHLQTWFSTLYYTLLVGVSAVSGLIVMIVIMLYRTVDRIVQILTPPKS